MSDDPMEHPALLFASARLIDAHLKLNHVHQAEADGLLDVLDQLTGFCAPSYALAPSPDGGTRTHGRLRRLLGRLLP